MWANRTFSFVHFATFALNERPGRSYYLLFFSLSLSVHLCSSQAMPPARRYRVSTYEEASERAGQLTVLESTDSPAASLNHGVQMFHACFHCSFFVIPDVQKISTPSHTNLWLTPAVISRLRRFLFLCSLSQAVTELERHAFPGVFLFL